MANTWKGKARERRAMWTGMLPALMAAACGGASPEESDASGDPFETQMSELKNGSLYNGSSYWRGVVKLEIYWPAMNTWVKCSGQVVSRQTILTAAHCVDFLGGNPASTNVKAFRMTTGGFTTVLPNVYSFVQYNPAHDVISAKYDVGLITAPSVQPLMNVAPNDAAMLATTAPNNTNMIALGFGFYGNNADQFDGRGRSGYLVPTYSTTALDYYFTNTATNPELCQGDSGGPLKGTTGHVLQYGIASRGSGFGTGKCRSTSHWATLANNMSWIRGKITGTCTEGAGYLCW